MGANRDSVTFPWELPSAQVTPTYVGTGLATFASLADLLALPAPSNGVAAQVSGTAAAGDGGGGILYYDADFGGPVDNVETFRPVGATTGAWKLTSQTTLDGDVVGPSHAAEIASIQGVAVPELAPVAGQFLRASAADQLEYTTLIVGDLPARTSDVDANHLLAWDLTEASGSTVNNTGTAGSAGNLTLSGTYDRAQKGLYGASVGFRPEIGRGWALGASSSACRTSRTAISVEAWVLRRSHLGRISYAVMQGLGGAFDYFTGPAIALGVNEDGAAMVRLATAAYVCPTVADAAPLTLQQPAHIAATFDGATIKLYTNAVLVASLAHSGSLLNTSSDGWAVNDNGDSDGQWASGTDFGGSWLINRVRVSGIVRAQSYFQDVVAKATFQ